MAPADFLDETRKEIAGRLKELWPLVEEYKRLEAAAAALDDISASTSRSTTASRSRRSGPQPAQAPARASHRRPGRPKGSGTRAAEALALVKARPGITIPQIAEAIGIKQNYLYRVLSGLAEDGLVVKDGRGWKPRDVG